MGKVDSMALDWDDSNGDAFAEHDGVAFEIECAGRATFWAFMGGKPIGHYEEMKTAKARCERMAGEKQ